MTPITTDSGTPAAPIIKYVAGTSTKVTVTGPTFIKPGDSARFTVTATDQFGNAVEGDNIDWSSTGAGTINWNLTNDTTDANGQVSAVLATASNGSGAGSLTADDTDGTDNDNDAIAPFDRSAS